MAQLVKPRLFVLLFVVNLSESVIGALLHPTQIRAFFVIAYALCAQRFFGRYAVVCHITPLYSPNDIHFNAILI